MNLRTRNTVATEFRAPSIQSLAGQVVRSRVLWLPAAMLAAVLLAAVLRPALAQEYPGGNRVYVYNSASFGGSSFSGAPQVIDLDSAAKSVGAGDGTRPHLLLFNTAFSHAVLAYVATGHVVFIDAAARKVVGNVDVGEQAHGALPSPDDKYVLVANQNGKKLARITTDYVNNVYVHNAAHDFDLKALEDTAHPDNAPICPVLWAQGGVKAYVTVRGGGLYIMDTASTPMKVLKSFTKDEVKPAGCGGVAVGTKMYINSGTATSSNLYLFDTGTDTLVKEIALQSPGTDAHGLAVVNRRYLWMDYRGEGDKIAIIDTVTDTQVGVITGFGEAPDLMDVSPAGDLVFATLRGPKNLTGGPSAKGSTPGLVVLEVKDGGASGALKMFVPIGPQHADSAADPHGIAVRRGPAPGSPYDVWVVDQADAIRAVAAATPRAVAADATAVPLPPRAGTGDASRASRGLQPFLPLAMIVTAALAAGVGFGVRRFRG